MSLGALELTHPPAAADPPRTRAAVWMLIVITAINVCNVIDRSMISVLLPSIKADLHITDSQIGLLSGSSFALFYVLFGLPLGWLAERVNRTRMISLALVIWSVMTLLSGKVANFGELLAIRIGVAIGEAGGSPPSYGMVSDAFPLSSRSFAMSVFTSAGALGGFLALMIGGWVAQFWGWRAAFMVAGAAGLLLLPLILFTVEDPRRGGADGERGSATPPPLAMALRYLARSRAFRHLATAAALSAFASYGLALWLPSFLARSYGFASGEIGTILGTSAITAGLAGTFAGGEFSRRMGARTLGWWALTPALGFTLAAPAYATGLFVHDPRITIVAIFIGGFGTATYVGPLWACAGAIAPPGMRSLASSVLLFVQMLLGLGLGPLLTGVVSDHAQLRFGDEALRYALLLPVSAFVLGAIEYAMAARSLAAEAHAATGPDPTAVVGPRPR